ncbi:Fc.00g004560.m01.CDS01 [Cosmosporella sp. VM-42]
MPPCQPERLQPPAPSRIERLPHELQRLIFSNLDYQSLIFLSTTNKHFNQHVKPQELADPMDKFEFVMRAAKDFPQHRPSEKGQDHKPGNFECYICFRAELCRIESLARMTGNVHYGGSVSNAESRKDCMHHSIA